MSHWLYTVLSQVLNRRGQYKYTCNHWGLDWLRPQGKRLTINTRRNHSPVLAGKDNEKYNPSALPDQFFSIPRNSNIPMREHLSRVLWVLPNHGAGTSLGALFARPA